MNPVPGFSVSGFSVFLCSDAIETFPEDMAGFHSHFYNYSDLSFSQGRDTCFRICLNLQGDRDWWKILQYCSQQIYA